MTEADAIAWLTAHFGEDKVALLGRYVELLLAEAANQNLIAPSTMTQVWSRHILDSAQLVPLASETGPWLDIGSGAGLPGLVAAILRPQRTLLVEPRRQRASFLQQCADSLGLTQVEVRPCRVEQVTTPAAIISARAVAPVEKLLHAATACGTPATRWLLPRGQSGAAELAALERRWTGVFHMKQSLTDAGSTILILDGPRRR